MVKVVTKRFQKRKDIKDLVNGLDGSMVSRANGNIICIYFVIFYTSRSKLL